MTGTSTSKDQAPAYPALDTTRHAGIRRSSPGITERAREVNTSSPKPSPKGMRSPEVRVNEV
jgi:hypothetical protein